MEYLLLLFSVVIIYIFSSLLSKLGRYKYLTSRGERYGGIDGLRGYLAFFVFIHHFYITWDWKVNGVWKLPSETLYANMGVVSVSLFFMITGFLFISKIKEAETNWKAIYISRFFRIIPLYIFTLVIITFVVFYSSNFNINSTLQELVIEYVRWFLFFGSKINQFEDTKIIIAAVDWTLKYEWAFYLLLPAISFVLRKNTYLQLSALLVILVLYFYPVNFLKFDSKYLILFTLGGVGVLINNESISKIVIDNKVIVSSISFFILSCVYLYTKPMSSFQILGTSVFFYMILLGDDLFGLLKKPGSLLLGEISYSIYLLHGVILYFAFSIIELYSFDNSRIDEFLYLLPILSLLLVIKAMITFNYIEAPFISLGRMLCKKVKMRTKYV